MKTKAIKRTNMVLKRKGLHTQTDPRAGSPGRGLGAHRATPQPPPEGFIPPESRTDSSQSPSPLSHPEKTGASSSPYF